ncbi:hypothetical protein V5799_001118 [Amblyomma americanum]|uniref:Tudor domain-containing protein n=1 Tax=Amblyomma americanum TaxID=6943 RepID=A0AAQ4D140_AMBAM
MGDLAQELRNVKYLVRALLDFNSGPTRFGYPDCLSFLENLTDTVHVQRTGGDVLISAKLDESVHHVERFVQARRVRHPAPRPIECPPRERPSAPQLPEAVQEKVLQLMGEGHVDEQVLREAYYRRFGERLDVQLYGFASMEDCLARVRLGADYENGLPQAIVAVLAQYPDGILMSRFIEARARELGRPPTLRTIQLLRRWAGLFRLFKTDPSRDLILQPDIYSAAALLRPEPLPARSARRVTDVRGSAAVLTVALLEWESEWPLSLLRAAMNHFYGSAAFVPPFDAEPGRPCAALCGDTWHRARVVIVTADRVLVELADVGERRLVAPQLLRTLAPRFSTLPALCIVATLTLPPGRRAWCETAGERLLQLTRGCKLTCLYDGTSVELLDEQGLLLTRQLALEGLCKLAWLPVTVSDEVRFNVVWLQEQRYIFSYDLSRLMGWEGDSALEELQRRGIGFQCVCLCRDSEQWCALMPLLSGRADTEFFLFPADNIADAVNLLCYPHNQVGADVKRELAKLQDM